MTDNPQRTAPAGPVDLTASGAGEPPSRGFGEPGTPALQGDGPALSLERPRPAGQYDRTPIGSTGPERGWRCALALDAARRVVAGSPDALVAAIADGADLRIGTEFRHNEHIDVRSSNPEQIREVAEFGVTYCIDRRWAAGIMSLRQPVDLPLGFGPRPSMSFFLYNQDGTQAIARPYLDGQPAAGAPGPARPEAPPGMPKYHTLDAWDAATTAPSSNFVFDFDGYRFFVNDAWEPVLAHGPDGRVESGSVTALAAAFADGCAVKIGVAGLCADLAAPGPVPHHELLVETGSGYYYTDQRLFIAGSHPVVRGRPGVPMRYRSQGWDFGWLVLRTDGRVVYRRCDPYTLAFADRAMTCAVRWFVRGRTSSRTA